jgi:flagellar basal-body rod modification protein FlgD
MSSFAINPLGSTPSATANSASQSSSATGGNPPTEQMFLNLLVAQMKNQDPSNPQDGSQFVAQLAQFSELEQVIGIRQDLDGMKAAGIAPATPASPTPTPTTPAGN